MPRWAAATAVVLVPHLVADPGRQPLDRVRERQVVDLLHEVDHVAALAAAEAVVPAYRWTDVERGGALVVERAEPLQRTGAGRLERELLADHVLDPDGLADVVDVVLADSHRGPVVPIRLPLTAGV